MSAEKLCFCLKLETGCVLLGFITFALSTGQIIFSAIFLAFSCHDPSEPSAALESPGSPNKTQHDFFELCPFNVTFGVQGVIAALNLIVSTAWMISSVLFIYGALKKKTNYVTTYFLVGVVVSLLFLLSALLEAIKGLWVPSTLTFILSVIYLKCLVSIYFAYDKMRREDQDEQLLVPEEDFSIDY